jgi:hypothetical protein
MRMRIGLRIRLFTLMRIWMQILASKLRLEKVLKLAYTGNPYILACHLQIDADPGPVPDPAYHLDADPDTDPDPDFYLMRILIWIRMRIQVTKMMRMHPISDADPDPQHWAHISPHAVLYFCNFRTSKVELRSGSGSMSLNIGRGVREVGVGGDMELY